MREALPVLASLTSQGPCEWTREAVSVPASLIEDRSCDKVPRGCLLWARPPPTEQQLVAHGVLLARAGSTGQVFLVHTRGEAELVMYAAVAVCVTKRLPPLACW